MPVPFYGKEFTFTQPDGTEIKVKGWGDQHYAVFETLDGFTVVRDPISGFYQYAKLTQDGQDIEPTGVKLGMAEPSVLGLKKNIRISLDAAREKFIDGYRKMVMKRRCEIRRERRKAMLRAMLMVGGPFVAPPSQGTKGDYVGLCLLAQFPDVSGTIPKSEVNDFCNKQGYSGYGNNGSVYDYFYDISEGNLKYTNMVAGYYTAKNPRSYYTNPAIPHGTRTRELIKEALTDLKTQGLDFYKLSADDEGYVYALNIFYSGTCPNNWAEGLWPHSWSLELPFELAPGRLAYDYQITDIGSELSLGTFCHENGHMVCDFPDLYDYGYQSSGVGVYCLMCAGNADKNPGHVCAYLKYKAGWSKKAISITDGMSATMVAEENEFYVYSKNQTEYFIIENRYDSGRDVILPNSGLAIWHVDELGSNDDEQMTTEKHYECSLEQADNTFDLEHGGNLGDIGDLYSTATSNRFSDSTNPSSNWWDGTASGLDIDNISDAGKNMTFQAHIFGGGHGVMVFQADSNPNVNIPDNNKNGIVDTIEFLNEALVLSVKVTVDISHTYRGDLLVTLSNPLGTSVVLHNRSGASADNLKATFDDASIPELKNFVGQSIRGKWKLNVQDLASVDVGSLNHWKLEIQAVQTITNTFVELKESPMITIPDNDKNGIERILSTNESGVIKDLAISVDITHTYIRDLIVTLISPSSIVVALHQRTGGGADNIIETYTPTKVPALNALIGKQIQGNWRLRVADVAGHDTGKLNYWAVKITR
jgi:M6 family metalloprotease-like protein